MEAVVVVEVLKRVQCERSIYLPGETAGLPRSVAEELASRDVVRLPQLTVGATSPVSTAPPADKMVVPTRNDPKRGTRPVTK